MLKPPNSIAVTRSSGDIPRLARWSADRVRSANARLRLRLSLWAAQIRQAAGLNANLPPGPIDASSMQDAAAEGFYRALHRDHGPIFKLFWGSGHFKICVVGFPLARRLFTEHRQALVPVTTDVSALVPQNFLRGMRPDVHRHYRRIFKSAFHDELIDNRQSDIRQIIRGELAALAESVDVHDAPAKRLYDTLDQVALRVTMLVTLGIDRSMGRATQIEAQFRRMAPSGHVAPVGDRQAAAFAAIKAAVCERALELSAPDTGCRDDSIMSRIIGDDRALANDDTVIGNLIYLVERGRHDLRDLLRWLVKHLSDHPGVIDELRTELADPRAKPALARACVHETLRLEQAIAVNRRTRQRITFEGYDIPKGSWVSVLLRESHGDPDTFAQPQRYCPHRFVDRQYKVEQYAPFGIDEHRCIADTFVVEIAAAFVEELVTGYSWTVTGDGPRAANMRPSPSFAIALQRNR